MKLYFSPLACSLATRIAFYEAGADASYVEVDPKTKLTDEGQDFRAVNPLGMVPTLSLDGGETLTENAAILQYVAEQFPEASLAPRDTLGRARLQSLLCFIGTELHKAIFNPLLDPRAPEGAKAFALSKVDARLAWLSSRVEGREFLLDTFTVADAYLVAVLNWTAVVPVELSRYPALAAYHARMLKRPSVARAVGEERVLYAREIEKHRTAVQSAVS